MNLAEELALARAVHVLAVVLWIGGVGLVTLVLLPAARARGAAEGLRWFHAVERRFARQARVTTLAAGASGFWMLARMDAWWRYAEPAWWWIHAMTLVWLVFTVMLFVAEPLILDRRLRSLARADPERALRLLLLLHRALLLLSLVTVAGAVAGAHGWSFGG